MAKEFLRIGRPGDEFIRELKQRLNGQLVELPDGRMQVLYDFSTGKQLDDWTILKVCDAHPTVTEGALTLGRIEEQRTDQQWDRDIRLDLCFGTEDDLEMEFDVVMGTPEPWTGVTWVFTGREGHAKGIPFLYADLCDWSGRWREERGAEKDTGHVYRDGYLRAALLRRCDREEGVASENEMLAPAEHVPASGTFHMKVARKGRRLQWTINEQPICDIQLSESDLRLTERLMLCNYGKGDAARFTRVLIRARISTAEACS